MKKNLLFTVGRFLLFCLLCFQQLTVTAQKVTANTVTASTGHVVPFLQYKPSKHDLTPLNRRYPMIIFLHGGGERSNNTNISPAPPDTLAPPVWQLTAYGPLRELGWHDLGFDWNGTKDTFIVVHPMSRQTSPWPTAYVDAMIKYGKYSLKADSNRIYLAGHSYGGAGVFNYLNTSTANVKNFAAAVPIAAWNVKLSTQGAKHVDTAKLPVWAFHAENDTITKPDTTIISINRLKALNPAVKPLLTIWPSGTVNHPHHAAPNWVFSLHEHPYLEDGLINIYEWLLGQNRLLSANIMPVANAGPDQTISSTPGTAVLDGTGSSDADGILRYQWKQIEGPVSISITNSATTKVADAAPYATRNISGLTTPGTYRFVLAVVDARAGFTRDTVTISVTAPSPGKAVSMNTTTSRINAANVSQLISASAFTVEAQFKYDSVGGDWWNSEAVIFRKQITTTDRLRLYVVKSSRSIHFTIANGTDVKGFTGSNVVAHDTWCHVAAVYDGSQTADSNKLKIYINGIQQALTFTGSLPSSTSSSSGSNLFGGEPSASQVTVIDDVRLWDTVLTQATINSWRIKELGNCHPNFNRLRVYWPMTNDASSTTAAAALGTSYPGIITNGSYVTSNLPIDTIACPLPPGKAVSMNTTTSRINAANVSQLISASAFTVEAQFKYDSVGGDWWNSEAVIFRKQITTTDRLRLYVVKSSRSIHFTIANGTDVKGFTGSNVVAHDTWCHVAAVYDGSQTADSNKLKIYINGIRQALTFTGSLPSSTSSSSGSNLFGGEPSANQVTVIDDVRLWDTVLTQATINSWRNMVLDNCHPNVSRLRVYWPMTNDASSTTAAAALGTSYPGVITNGSYVDGVGTVSSGCVSPAVLSDYTEEAIAASTSSGKLYPNPTRGPLQVAFTTAVATSVTVNVIDMYGKLVYRKQASVVKGPNILAVDISALRSGNYFIDVRSGAHFLGKYKIVKQ